jgi:hypothetical protein
MMGINHMAFFIGAPGGSIKRNEGHEGCGGFNGKTKFMVSENAAHEYWFNFK